MILRASGSGEVNDAQLSAFVHNPGGPIRQDLTRRAVAVQASMTRGCPRHTHRLVNTIRKNDGRVGPNPSVDVLCGRDGLTDYLGYVLAGTSPHLIRPRNRQVLRFMAGGAIVFTTLVRHPGTAPNNFMLRALPEAIR
jgi:hypothetical protein